MTSALGGITVLDLTGSGPASFVSMMMGDMGAEVIKISAPPGTTNKGVAHGIEMAYQPALEFGSLRSKKNLALNLKTEAGRDIFCKLAGEADVVIEAFRPGVIDRLGIGYHAIAEINSGIIYCSVSGYGQDGPYRDLPGHDPNYAGMGGALSLIGYSAKTPPVIVQNTLADLISAIQQPFIGILLAICARERTGRGQQIDISMMDGVIFALNTMPDVAEYLLRGTIPRRGETFFSGTSPWYSVYETSDDKYITLCPLEPHFWRNMCTALDREDLIAHLFAPNPKMEEVYDELKQIFRTKTRDEWFELLVRADVPAGKVLEVDEVFSDEHVLHRQMVIEVDRPPFGKVKQIGFPIKFSDTPAQVQGPCTGLGENTNEVLTGRGYSQEEIERLRQEGIIY